MKRALILITLLAFSPVLPAQERIKVSDLVDLEERILVKKMTDELNKPGPNNTPPAPAIVVPKSPRITYPTETLAVYGTNATFYEGQLSMGGRTYTVRTGSPVQGYIVSSVTPHGIELSKPATAKRGKRSARSKEPERLFAPLITR